MVMILAPGQLEGLVTLLTHLTMGPNVNTDVCHSLQK